MMESNRWSIQNIVSGETFVISKSVFKVGRNINADITSLTGSLSRNHATFSILIDGLLYLQDNNSCNGTFVNNQKIIPMEMKLVKNGDIIGFGCCQQFCNEKNVETPLIFKILENNEKSLEDVSKQNIENPLPTVKNEFSISDCIDISDEEDNEDLFSNSQIYKISERIKNEKATINESVDPYSYIKQELEDLDYCDNNQYVVDLTEEENCFEKTSDLLDVLESPIQNHATLNEENPEILTRKKYVKPPIIEPHVIERVNVKKEEGSTSTFKKQIGDIKYTCKRKSSITSPHVKKKGKSLLDTKGNHSKAPANECKKRNSKSPNSTEKRAVFIEERKRKLKEIATNNESVHITKPKVAKSVAKVKSSNSRGTFLLEECLTTPKKKIPNKKNSLPSTSKCITNKTIKMQNTDLEIQDTTINCRLKNDSEKPENLMKPSNTIPNIIEGSNLTYNEKQSGIIWQSHFLNTTVKDTYKKITVDDSIWKILKWSVKWLMEQNNIDRSPPVNGEEKPKEMPLNFVSFLDYIEVVSALIMLELWQYIYQMLYNTDERSPIKVYINHKRIVGKVAYLDCECYLPEEEVKMNFMPRMDDLVLIEFKVKDAKKYFMYTQFAYIKCCKRKYLQKNTMVDSHSGAPCSGTPCMNLTFTIMTKCHQDIIGTQVIIKVIANIGSHLKLLKGIKYLETSSICKNILFPKAEDFRISSRHKDIIVEVNLNKEQKQIVQEASELCLGNIPGLYLIKGPPGTGKSTVIINIVLQILFSSLRDNPNESPLILLTAPSNAAVDGLILKLGEIRKKLTETQRKHMKMVRVGPESSISANVDKFKLSSLARNHMLKDQRLTSLSKFKDVIDNGGDIDQFLKNFFGHNYLYELRCAEDVLLYRSNIICTTLNSSVSPKILEPTKRNKLKFSCCIIDEATQCSEPESLLPIQLGIEKFILVGDPQQLPAVVCNKEAQKLGYAKSLFARIDDNFKNSLVSPIKMLCEQYRMRHEICEYPNKRFYNGKLNSSPLHINKITPDLKPYLLFNLLSTENEDELPYRNSQEVKLIYTLMQTLRKHIESKCRYTIGIITPYRAQKEYLIKEITGIKFNENVSVTINTVDSFQGMENDIVIISCVRYTPNYFLQNEQRLNVALTRARQALYIIGNYSLFKHCQPLYDLREDAKKRKLCIDIKKMSVTNDFSKYILKV